MSAFTAKLDRAEEKRMLARYKPREVDLILRESAKVGGKAGAAVLKSRAPIGTAERLSQFYRRMGLVHGTFRKSVRAAAIRGRGSAVKGLQAATIGYVMGPIGKNAFTRRWIERGTSHQRANPWVETAAPLALGTARTASEAVLTRYASQRP